MTAPNVIQVGSPVGNTGTSAAATLNGVTPGSTLAVMIFQTATGIRTYSAIDNIDGAWSQAVYRNETGSRASGVLYKIGSSGGNITITVTISVGSPAFVIIPVELEASTLDVVSSFSDAVTNVTSHYCAESGSIDTSTDVVILSGGVLNASGGTLTKNAAATLIASTTQYLFQYRRSDAALTNERSEWTTTTARQNQAGVSAAFKTVAADAIAPTLSSAVINSAGSTLTLNFDEIVLNSTGITLTGELGSLTATYSSGSGTTALVFNLNRSVYAAEVITLNYTPGNIQDAAGNALASISSRAVTNNSTVPLPIYTYQHIKNGTDISGATSSALTINPSASGDSGSYSVRITSLISGKSKVIPLPQSVVVT